MDDATTTDKLACRNKKVNYLSPRTNIQERPNRSDDDQLSWNTTIKATFDLLF